MNRYAVLFVVCSLFLPLVYAQQIQTFVNDYAHILSPSDFAAITDVAQQIYDSGIAQYAIVTVNTTNGQDIQEYGLDLAQGKLGDTEKQNGVLLLVAINDRSYWFEVGKGIEGTLNDAKVGRLGRIYLIPNFQNGTYSKGILDASVALRDILLSNETDTNVDEQSIQELPQWSIFVIFILIILFFAFISHIQRKAQGRYHDAAEGAIVIFGGGRGGFGGFGGSGGFGGGGFGGGGAGGKW